MSYIDNYATPGNPVVDITGKPLGIQLLFADKGAQVEQSTLSRHLRRRHSTCPQTC